MTKKQQQQSNVITIDNKEYETEKLSEKAKFCIQALSSNQAKRQQLEIEINNVDVCLSHYSKELKKELIDL
jgi:hypothetical protein|tara:strand:+ start:1579 stop:1791 length:213 start_codon:yes stop_codon:yes gene_type:complete